jgi:hypothetical protein
VQEALYKEAQTDPQKKNAVMNKITLLRLPLGTGNDGTDGHSIPELFDILKSQLVYVNAPALKVYPEKMPSEAEIVDSALKYGKKRENSIHFRVKIIYILEDEIKTAMNWTVCWPVWAICTDISPIHGKTQQD